MGLPPNSQCTREQPYFSQTYIKVGQPNLPRLQHCPLEGAGGRAESGWTSLGGWQRLPPILTTTTPGLICPHGSAYVYISDFAVARSRSLIAAAEAFPGTRGQTSFYPRETSSSLTAHTEHSSSPFSTTASQRRQFGSGCKAATLYTVSWESDPVNSTELVSE